MILLDTNIAIAILNKSSVSIRREFERQMAMNEQIAVSSIVVFELQYGVAKSRKRKLNQAALSWLLSGPVGLLPFGQEDAIEAGNVRAKLEAAGSPIGPYDVLIAGQALRHGATLVTSNTREFRRVKGLKWEDWGR
jgi:tRNA(fMet)-specific endonuclease VapC